MTIPYPENRKYMRQIVGTDRLLLARAAGAKLSGVNSFLLGYRSGRRYGLTEHCERLLAARNQMERELTTKANR